MKNLEKDKKPPQEFLCPISMNIMKEPVIMEDGHTYEKECIKEWLTRSSKSPLTREEITLIGMRTNYALKTSILRWHEEGINTILKEEEKQKAQELPIESYQTAIDVLQVNNPPPRETPIIPTPTQEEVNAVLRQRLLQLICLAIIFLGIIILSFYYIFIGR